MRPTKSYGIIAFDISDGCIKYLLGRRYTTYALDTLLTRFDSMSNKDRNRYISNITSEEYNTLMSLTTPSKNNLLPKIRTYIRESGIVPIGKDIWVPLRGRKERREDEVECAKREFKEESGMIVNRLIYNGNELISFVENIKDGRSYKIKYYLTNIKGSGEGRRAEPFGSTLYRHPHKGLTYKEIKELRWVTLAEGKDILSNRPSTIALLEEVDTYIRNTLYNVNGSTNP